MHEHVTSRREDPTSMQMAKSLDIAVHDTLALTSEPGFYDALRARQMDPTDFDNIGTPPYLEALASYGQTVAQAEPDPLVSSAKALVTATPLAIYNEDAILRARAESRYIPQNEYSGMVRPLSIQNGLIRDFSASSHDTKFEDLLHGMYDAANMVIEDEALMRIAPDIIRAELRGARHEIAVGQLLEASGREFTPANAEQDMDKGDYLIDTNGRVTYLDAKASTMKIAKPGATPVAHLVRDANHIAIFSLCNDSDFNGRMMLPPRIVKEKAPLFDMVLRKAQAEMLGMKIIERSLRA